MAKLTNEMVFTLRRFGLVNIMYPGKTIDDFGRITITRAEILEALHAQGLIKLVKNTYEDGVMITEAGKNTLTLLNSGNSFCYNVAINW